MAFDRGFATWPPAWGLAMSIGRRSASGNRSRPPPGQRVTVEQHGVVMVLGENLGRRQTNAAGGAGDQDCFIMLKSPPRPAPGAPRVVIRGTSPRRRYSRGALSTRQRSPAGQPAALSAIRPPRAVDQAEFSCLPPS